MKKTLVCLALILIMIGCGLALEVEYKTAEESDHKITVWDCGGGYYIFDLQNIAYLQMYHLERATIFLQALAKFENNHSDLKVITAEPFLYGGEGGTFLYYIKCGPKDA